MCFFSFFSSGDCYSSSYLRGLHLSDHPSHCLVYLGVRSTEVREPGKSLKIFLLHFIFFTLMLPPNIPLYYNI